MREQARVQLINGLARLVLYGGCMALFFGMMAVNNWQIRHPSRTLATTLLTWLALAAAMMAVYGGLVLGRKRRRLLICEQALACLATDAVTYLQLQIMNVNSNNKPNLVLFGEDFPWLLLCVALQMALVTAVVCGGTALLCRTQSPKRALLILGDVALAPLYRQKLQTSAKCWKVADVCAWEDAELPKRIEQAETVFIGADVPDDVRMSLLLQCYDLHLEVLCKAKLQDILLSNARQSIVDDAPFLEIDACRITFGQRIVKRAMDVLLSVLLLLLLWPLMAVVALLIRWEDGGPVIFRQERLTAAGKRFTIRKFRTMRSDARPDASVITADARVTRLGHFLRRWRLDELPQLVNILVGDMSFVGPRPEMLENVARYKRELPSFVYRERMKAGLTGYAQIEGRYNTSPEDKLMLDMMYIESFSLWEDVKLLLRTVLVFFKPDSTEGFDAARRGAGGSWKTKKSS